LMLGARWYNF